MDENYRADNNMTQSQKPNYFCVIPANVRYDQNLSSTAKLLYGEITALTNKNGFCFASNSYFAKLFNVSERQITNLLNQLSEKNYIRIEIVNNFQRKIYISELGGVKKISGGVKKISGGGEKNFTHNNINRINNIFKNILLAKNQKKQFGNKTINFILEEFKKRRGFYPTDKKPRQRAWNLVQKVNTFIKNHSSLPEVINTPEKLIERYFIFLSKKDYFNNIENLDTIVRKLELFFGLIEKKLKEQEIIKKQRELKKQQNIPPVNQEIKDQFEEAKKKLLEKFSFKT